MIWLRIIKQNKLLLCVFTFYLILITSILFASVLSGRERLILKSPSAISIGFFESKILPNIEKVFSVDIVYNGTLIKRSITYVELLSHEIVGKQNHYYVHIEYNVQAWRKRSGMFQASVRMQQILFRIENEQIVDVVDFGEKVIYGGAFIFENQ